MSDLPSSVKFRLLYLHGIGTNCDILETQTGMCHLWIRTGRVWLLIETCAAPLRHHLGDGYGSEFLEGAYLWPPAPGVQSLFGEQPCYSYFDGSPQGAAAAVDDLADYLHENGPFDAVVGFSLGAALAASLLLRNEQQGVRHQVRCAVFVCGVQPCDWSGLRQGTLHLLQAEDVQRRIHLPTVHAWSPGDTEYPGQSQHLVQMCSKAGRFEVVHSAGHSVPTNKEEVGLLAEAIRHALKPQA
ncbi:serine hydrolase FSH [Xylariaceae sp. FL0804]|nr:serine hydrolase FSH [Xylariaceae sp. FL0804]